MTGELHFFPSIIPRFEYVMKKGYHKEVQFYTEVIEKEKII